MKRLALFALLSSTALLTACGGGGTSGSPAAVPPAATPTPQLTAAPTPQPPGSLSAVDGTNAPVSALSFASPGLGFAQTFRVTQPNFAGSLSESNTCSNVATVSPVSNASGVAVFSVTPTGGGSCTITVSGGAGQKLTISVGVTATPISVN